LNSELIKPNPANAMSLSRFSGRKRVRLRSEQVSNEFCSLEDADTFIWLRAFDNSEKREELLNALGVATLRFERG